MWVNIITNKGTYCSRYLRGGDSELCLINKFVFGTLGHRSPWLPIRLGGDNATSRGIGPPITQIFLSALLFYLNFIIQPPAIFYQHRNSFYFGRLFCVSWRITPSVDDTIFQAKAPLLSRHRHIYEQMVHMVIIYRSLESRSNLPASILSPTC